ncbi:MAG TPA: HNH endonuclease [Polyangiaceae bacterium]|nr:HNH endonuclease [Polyangiaceae bacterium]
MSQLQSAACSNDETHHTKATWAQAEWQRAHDELLRLARSRAGLDFEEGRWLVLACQSRVHARLGYGSFNEYVARLFGYGARLVQEKLRVAEALERLPEFARALKQGDVCWSALRELTRVATPETEAVWLAAAAGQTVRELEKLVSGLAPGSRPGDPSNSEDVRHVLRFEVTGEVLACVREALTKLRRDAGEALDDEAALLLMARTVLEGPRDDGRASYQIALTVCEHCQSGGQDGAGESTPVGSEVVEMAGCDAQHLGPLTTVSNRAHVGANTARAAQDVPPAVRRLVLRRDHGRCVVPGCKHATWVDVHHLQAREEGGAHEPSNLITICGAHHRALHRGCLRVEGTPASGLTFRHADGSAYGRLAAPAVADAGAKAFQALRGLGFRESEVRWALGQLPYDSSDESVEAQVRACLLSLTERLARAS